MDNNLFTWDVLLSNGQTRTLQGSDLQVSNGALILYMNGVPVQGLNSNLWFSFTLSGTVEKSDNNDLIQKLLNFVNQGKNYPGLASLAQILGCKERDLEWHLSNLLKNKKIPIRWAFDPVLQRSLDDVMPGLIKRHGKEMKMLLEMLQQKNETRETDYIQLYIWLSTHLNS